MGVSKDGRECEREGRGRNEWEVEYGMSQGPPVPSVQNERSRQGRRGRTGCFSSVGGRQRVSKDC